MKGDSGGFLNNFISPRFRKIIGGGLITLGVLMAIPPTIPSPDDILNIVGANLLTMFTTITSTQALILTYTLIPLVLIISGIVVFPKKDGVVATMIVVRLRKLFGKLKDLKVLIVLLVIGYFYWKFLETLVM